VQRIKRALLSVSDKTGLIPFARFLHHEKVEILSTGGTLAALKEARIPARSVSDFTGFPEILEGRVKTLHPKIHGGILYRRDKQSHAREAREHGLQPIDLVVVNLYPFEEVIKRRRFSARTVSLHLKQTAIENIDIGGPAMLRSAAKNHESVVVVTDPADYPVILEEMRKHGGKVSPGMRSRLAEKVFERTATYDRAIADYLKQNREARSSRPKDTGTASLPSRLDAVYEKSETLRYGENPHQRGALYRELGGSGLDFKVLHGKEISFNNLLDFEATLNVLHEFDRPTACVVKHTNPCGIAEGKNLTQAVEKAIACDPMSAFGGIVGLNRSCDLKTAKKIYELLNFLEIVVTVRFEAKALEFLKTRKNVRLIEIGDLTEGGPWDLRFTKLGVLLQDRDRIARPKLKWVTKARLGKRELEELFFAWKCVKTVRSNAIVIAQDRQTVGIGAGQMSRVDSVQIAIRKAGFRAEGGFLASDAFFPMPDSIKLAEKAKIKAIIQPGGSIRDPEVIEACDRAGIAMVLTGVRHFRH